MPAAPPPVRPIRGQLIHLRFARPPVVDLEFEMDVRGAAREIAL